MRGNWATRRRTREWRVTRRRSSVGAIPTRQEVAPAGSNRSGSGGNDTAEAFDGKGRLGRLREQAGRNVSERRAGLETGNVGADPASGWGRPPSRVSLRGATSPLPGVPPGQWRRHVCTGRSTATREAPAATSLTSPAPIRGYPCPLHVT